MTVFEGFVDYAGLFPPASLSMRDAVTEYLRALARPERSILGPFVVPASRLDELRLVLTSPIDVSVLVSGDVKAVLDAITAAAGVEDVHIVAYEVRLEPGLTDATAVLEAANPQPVFFEIAVGDTHDLDHLAMLAASFPDRVHAKFRTGGLTPESIPPVDALATSITGAVRRRLPFKATAGLHHPVRGLDPERGFVTHGFLNVAFAALAGDEAEAARLLQDDDPSNFSANPPAYRGTPISDEGLRVLRKRMTSFGCCSVADPHDGLARLGWEPQR